MKKVQDKSESGHIEDEIALNSNPLVQFLKKLPEEFTKADLIKFVESQKIELLNFRYVGSDGKLKILNFAITSKSQLDKILSAGERVDGSSLFPYVDASSSDLYVIPRYKTAFLNPFSTIPTLDILCSYFDSKGEPLASAPENTVRKAHQALKKATGLTLEAMGELEYYVFYEKTPLYHFNPQKGYHESAPFAKWEDLRCDVLHAFAKVGGKVKYGHSEVGNISFHDLGMEQHEVELFPIPIEEAADQVVILKWILRKIGYKYGVTISFAPKVLVGHAGSGMHIHSRLVKNGKNMMVNENKLSDIAKKAIAGYLTLAPSLTSFGNTVPISYLRLVPHQEAPTNICWGDRNRSVLVRVPLGWLDVRNMDKNANPAEKSDSNNFSYHQTVEFRGSDGSADIYLLLAGMAVAARHGLQMKNSLDIAKKLYVDVNIFNDEYKDIQHRLPQLPVSCWESADCLLKDRKIYEKDGVFSPVLVDGLVKILKGYDDQHLSEKLHADEKQIKNLAEVYLHCA